MVLVSSVSVTIAEIDQQTAHRICNGSEEAFDWMQMGRIYIHEIDDLIDEDIARGAHHAQAAQRVCRIGAIALDLYTHSFFLKNAAALKAAMMLNTINYADSVAWEDSKVDWQRQFSDWSRHGWIDVCLTIARICGGYDHAKAISLELRTNSYVDHHDKETGQAT